MDYQLKSIINNYLNNYTINKKKGSNQNLYFDEYF
jgi:hypothetical protein